jgi:hypothetical protein
VLGATTHRLQRAQCCQIIKGVVSQMGFKISHFVAKKFRGPNLHFPPKNWWKKNLKGKSKIFVKSTKFLPTRNNLEKSLIKLETQAIFIGNRKKSAQQARR